MITVVTYTLDLDFTLDLGSLCTDIPPPSEKKSGRRGEVSTQART